MDNTAFTPGRIIHCCMDISGLIQHARAPRRLDGIYLDRNTGRKIPGEEVLAMAIDLASKGYEAIPACDHHDAKGYCLGHQQEAAQ